jgi:hypothetical protein
MTLYITAAAAMPARAAATAAWTGDGLSPDVRLTMAPLTSPDMTDQLRLPALRRPDEPVRLDELDCLSPLPDAELRLRPEDFGDELDFDDERDLDDGRDFDDDEPDFEDDEPDFDEPDFEDDEPDFDEPDRDDEPDFDELDFDDGRDRDDEPDFDEEPDFEPAVRLGLDDDVAALREALAWRSKRRVRSCPPPLPLCSSSPSSSSSSSWSEPESSPWRSSTSE